MDQSTSAPFGDDRLPERFWTKVSVQPEGCWQWTAVLTQDGYPKFRYAGEMARAHRLSYALLHDEIPEGMALDHLCRNRACVRPVHLEPVTPRENVLRGRDWAARNAMPTHCSNGHELTPENIRMYRGSRRCRECRRRIDRDRKHHARRVSELSKAVVQAADRLRDLQATESDLAKVDALYEVEMELRQAASVPSQREAGAL
ncbi:HNH endonuclease signature motif containing protein [Streptomyces sp. C3-3]|uniref:HNH endonuclease signature motif containing protein n=1 Tax=Streptomyces sp. C3-3 TaxID=2824901 RepID=UPI001B366D9A|nr:HNH endonuclease signature motif containing protein [Streptomyces sp. C3-3]MBQ1112291.1 HNH endonuclease [Streptomyces sp. C3-3]